MCGILAYIADHSIGTDHHALASVTHRGPDTAGIKTFSIGTHSLTLGHRRLSIIDLTAEGAQPMTSGNCWIVYNGEIYNYLELRSALEKAGYIFKSNSDTEVLLNAYRYWGTTCLDRLNGMFAFVIWDNNRGELFAGRDRFGIKPLYYWPSQNSLAFASEIKQFTKLEGFEPRLNLDEAFQFLHHADFSYSHQTLWSGVFELEPGMVLRLNLNTWRPGQPITPTRWYSVPIREPVPIKKQEALEHFRFLLEDAIRLRLRADVEVGTALSGGLDSSAITCLIAKILQPHRPLHTFSASYRAKEGNESHFARLVLREIEARAHEVLTDPEFVITHMERATWHHDLPLIGRAVLPYYHLCDFVHSHGLKVVLQGQGADEILGGYGEFHRAFLSELLIQRKVLQAVGEYWHYRKYNAAHLRSDAVKIVSLAFPHLRATPPQTYPQTYLRSEIIDQIADAKPVLNRLQPTVPQVHAVRFTALRMLLHNVDRASMAHSVEARVPFLDHRLAEFCLALPSQLKIGGGVRKNILREALQDVLPVAVKNRTDKMGFSSPEATWAKGPLKAFYKEHLHMLHDNPLIDAPKAEKQYERFLLGEAPFDRALWRLISFQCWMSQFRIAS